MALQDIDKQKLVAVPVANAVLPIDGTGYYVDSVEYNNLNPIVSSTPGDEYLQELEKFLFSNE